MKVVLVIVMLFASGYKGGMSSISQEFEDISNCVDAREEILENIKQHPWGHTVEILSSDCYLK